MRQTSPTSQHHVTFGRPAYHQFWLCLFVVDSLQEASTLTQTFSHLCSGPHCLDLRYLFYPHYPPALPLLQFNQQSSPLLHMLLCSHYDSSLLHTAYHNIPLELSVGIFTPIDPTTALLAFNTNNSHSDNDNNPIYLQHFFIQLATKKNLINHRTITYQYIYY